MGRNIEVRFTGGPQHGKVLNLPSNSDVAGNIQRFATADGKYVLPVVQGHFVKKAHWEPHGALNKIMNYGQAPTQDQPLPSVKDLPTYDPSGIKILEKQYADLCEQIADGDYSAGTFGFTPRECLIQLTERRDTLSHVFEMLNVPEKK